MMPVTCLTVHSLHLRRDHRKARTYNENFVNGGGQCWKQSYSRQKNKKIEMKVSIKENVFKMLKVQEKFARVDVQNSGSIYEDKKSDSNILLLKGSSFLNESLCYSYTSA